MRPIFIALVAASLTIPGSAFGQGKSGDKRQDIGFPFETRGECERAAQRSNSAARKQGQTVRYECVQEGDTFVVREVSETESS